MLSVLNPVCCFLASVYSVLTEKPNRNWSIFGILANRSGVIFWKPKFWKTEETEPNRRLKPNAQTELLGDWSTQKKTRLSNMRVGDRGNNWVTAARSSNNCLFIMNSANPLLQYNSLIKNKKGEPNCTIYVTP